MKTLAMKIAILAISVGIALPASAKPAKTGSLDISTFSAEQQGVVVAVRGVAGRTLGPRIDVPISRARPSGST